MSDNRESFPEGIQIDRLVELYEEGGYQDTWEGIRAIDFRLLNGEDQKKLRAFVGRVAGRIAASIRELKSRLLSEGFVFEDESQVIREPTFFTQEQYRSVVLDVGQSPLILECLYDHIDSVNFSQIGYQRDDKSSPFFQSQFYISLIIGAPSHSLHRWKETHRISKDPAFLESIGRTSPIEVERFVETGPVLGSGEPVGFRVPCHMADADYYIHLVTKQAISFVEEMRNSIAMAGFAGLLGHPPSHPLRKRMSAIGSGLVQF